MHGETAMEKEFVELRRLSARQDRLFAAIFLVGFPMLTIGVMCLAHAIIYGGL